MTSFQGYARASSVGENTIRVNDPSQKILADADKKSRRMRQNSEAKQNARRDHLQNLRNKFNKEQENRRANSALEKEFADSWKAAVSKNWETKIKNAENAAKNARPDMLSQLAEFVPQIANDLKKIDDIRRADGIKLGRSLGFQFGISTLDIDALNSIKGNLRDYEGKNISIINTLREKGASWDQIQQIRNLSGYRRAGVAESEAQRAGENFQSWLIGKNNIKVKLGDALGEHSYATAKLSGNYQNLTAALNNHWQTEYLDTLKHLDHDLVLKYVRDPVVRAQSRMTSDTMEYSKKIQQQDVHNQSKDLLKTEVRDKGMQGFIDQIHLDAGVDRQWMTHARQKNVGYMEELFEDGTFNSNDLFKLRNLMVVPHGQKKAVRYEDQWGADIDRFEAAMVKNIKNQKAINDSKQYLIDAKNEAQAREFEAHVISKYETLKPRDFASFYKAAVTSGNDKLITAASKWMNRQPSKVNDKINEPHLFMLENKNLLTRSAVLDAQLSPELEGKWLKKADALSPFKPTDKINKDFERESKRAIENILSRYNTESKKVQSSVLATDHGVNMMRKYYKKAMIATNGDSEASKIQAIAEFNQLLTTDQYQIEKFRTVNGTRILEPHFSYFQVSPQKFAYPLSEYTTERFRSNPDIFREEVMVPPNEIIEWAHNVKAGINKGYPVSIQHLVGKMGNNPDGTPKVTEAQVAYEQLKLILGEEKASTLIPPELIQVSSDALEVIDPMFRKLLKLGPQGINTALHFSQKTTAPDYQSKPVSGRVSTWQSDSPFRKEDSFSNLAWQLVYQGGMA